MRTMMHAAIATISAGLALGCASTDPQVRSAGVDEFNTAANRCPMEVSGAVAQYQDTGDGVAIVLTTAAGDVDELRMRAHDLATAFRTRFGAVAQPTPRKAFDRAEDALDKAEDRREAQLDQAEDRLDEAEDRAEEAADELGDVYGDDVEDAAEDLVDRQEDAAEESLERAEDAADAAEDRGEEAIERGEEVREFQAERADDAEELGGMTQITVVEVPNGARIVFKPGQTASINQMREQVRTEVDNMRTGRCPIMTPTR